MVKVEMTNGEIFDRPGRFTLQRELVQKSPDIALRIMGQCIVLRAEALAWNDVIEYTALSMCFEKHIDGSLLPHYDWVTEGEPGFESATARKRKD